MVDFEQIRRDRERSKKGRRVFLISALFFSILFAVFLFFILRGKWFCVQSVSVDGIKGVFPEVVSDRIWQNVAPQSWLERFVFPHNNIFLAFFRRDRIESDLLSEYPLFSRGALVIDAFSRSIRFSVVERQQYGLWCGYEGECLWFDSSGVAFTPGPKTEGQLIKKVIDLTDRIVYPGERVLDQRATESLIAIFSFLEIAGIPERTLVLDSYDSHEVRTTGERFPLVYFSTRFDPFFASKTVEQLIASKKSFDYIDLRVKNRVYYK